MTEQKPQHKGRDFAIGFISSLIPIAISLFLMNTNRGELALGGTLFLLISGAGLLLCAISAFIRHRRFIGLGILSLMITAPLLICGACSTY